MGTWEKEPGGQIMKNSIYMKIKKFIEKNCLIKHGDKIVTGVSGGADSVLLFLVLAELSKEYRFPLCAVHVNHGIRGDEALRDEKFTVSFVEGLGYRCRVFHKNIPEMAGKLKLSEEEAGRLYRYQCFRDVQKELGYNKTAVAHHKDDQAETMLFQLIRGSSIRGLGGMRPENGDIIRPLLCVRRREIEEALREEGVKYCNDSTNADSGYARNRIRNIIIPYIAENIQPSVVEIFSETASQSRDIYDYIDRQAGEAYLKAVKEEDGLCVADADILCREDIVLQREVFMRMAAYTAGRRKDITSRHIDMLTGLLAGKTGRRINLPYGLYAGRDYNKIWIKKITGSNVPGSIDTNNNISIVNIEVPGETTLEYNNGKKHIILFEKKHREELPETIQKNNCTKCFDYDKIKFMPQFRHPAEGDYMLLGTGGGRKKLSRILIDSKVPVNQRGRLWLLAEGSHILWIPALGRCSAYYYVTDQTKEVLCAIFIEGEKD